ncbi:hypothetical protein T492DRAFT_1052188 [Pavlovales sp. CCMP2436]|nr:hypothetical protein T492DRAFT_1052188 [Pavlovales sp. CCMP2436]|mmetsp:Transcript_5125/g.13327  ORF Transcript_5125/g.13327 Transcript_5125/m.13327 type:complete len:469 (-) Transcript_5125:191-1597(-)
MLSYCLLLVSSLAVEQPRNGLRSRAGPSSLAYAAPVAARPPRAPERPRPKRVHLAPNGQPAAAARRAEVTPLAAVAATVAAAKNAPEITSLAAAAAAASVASRSPLYLLTQKKEITALISYLQQSRLPIEQQPDAAHELQFSRSQIEMARSEFDSTLRNGEQNQHTLCMLLGQRLLGRYYLQSVVVGELPRTRHRFELSQRMEPTTLRSETDLALGNRVLSQHRMLSNGKWVAPNLVASFVEYHPTVPTAVSDEHERGELAEAQIYKMISRIKAEQEIFNKVCDEIFDLDQIVKDLSREDKKLASLGHFVKDVFGLKFVVGTVDQARELQAAIENIVFTDDELAGVTAGAGDVSRKRLRFIEVKDHLGAKRKGNSGWECVKSIFEWNGQLFEVQIQPLINYCLERERLTKQSHDAYKAKREAARDQVANTIPLFGFYRDILRTLFVEPPSCGGLNMPKFKQVRVLVSD